MKQTLEEAAIKHQNGFSTCEDASVLGAFSKRNAPSVISRLSLVQIGRQSNLRG